jgi:hypothetical protein
MPAHSVNMAHILLMPVRREIHRLRIQTLKKEGARRENKVTPIALPGSNLGDGNVDNLCSYHIIIKLLTQCQVC